MLVNELLEISAGKFPERVALIFDKQRYTYEEVNNAANHLAAYMISIGVKRHDRVAILLDNSIESIISIFAILKAGAIFVMLSPAMKSAKLKYIFIDSGSCLLISHVSKYHLIKSALQGVSTLRHMVWCGSNKNNGDQYILDKFIASTSWHEIFAINIGSCFFPSCIDVDLSNIIYTSGSTGEPKGVMSAHYNVLTATRSIASYLKMTEQDIVMNVLPLSFDYGLYQVFLTFYVAGTLLLEKSFIYPYQTLQKMVIEKVTGFPIVPTMAALILQMDCLSEMDFSSLRFITNTAAALTDVRIQQLQKIFPHAQIYSMYGLTECKRVSYLPPEDLNRKPGSVGIAMPNEEVFVVDENGNELPANAIGELVVRGANVMQGYWNDPAATLNVFRPGRYRGETLLYSGDLFYKDEEGYLYFISRKDDMIKTKGERVSPLEVEAALLQMPEVSEAAVFGVPDPVYGQAIMAIIVPNNEVVISDQDVRKYCIQHIEMYMVPKYVEFMNNLPKSSNGKIDKKNLLSKYMNISKAKNPELKQDLAN